MEDQLIQLLSNAQSSDTSLRLQAEIDLKRAESNPAYPTALANVAAHTSVDTNIRQGALSSLRLFIQSNWSPDPYDDAVPIPIADDARTQLKQTLLNLAISPEEERKVKISTSYAIGKMAIHDFPEQWPDLLPTVLNVIPSGSDAQLHGALKVLGDLVEESLSEDQFFSMARDIASTLTEVALNENRKPILRALAISVFRGCFDMMNMIKEDHGKEVKAFAEELLTQWNPFFLTVLKSQLPEADLNAGPQCAQPESWNNIISLKLQVAKTLLRIRKVFPAVLLPQSTALFTAVWEELTLLQRPFEELYIKSDAQGKLEDADSLPYTLDLLILEEIDFLNQCFRAGPVQAELDGQLKAHAAAQDVPWMMDIMRMLVSYSQVTCEEKDLWDIDCSLYLAEETSVTANYTARVAASDLLIKMGEWFDQKTVEGLFAYTKSLFSGDEATWRNQEAALFLFVMLASDFQDLDKTIPDAISTAYLELVDFAINRADVPLLRARGFLLAGMLCRTFEVPSALLDRMISSITQEEAEIVQVACIKAVEGLINAGKITADRQIPIIKAIEQYMSGRDPEEMEDADELLVTLSEALRAATRLDCKVALSNDVPSIDLLFLLARIGASNFQVTMMVSEAVEEIVRSLDGPEAFAALCSKIVPILMGAYDVSRLTEDNPLVTVATELLDVLVEHGSEPFPPGFVAAVFPKLTKVLMESSEGDVLRPGASAAKWVLMHDPQQVFDWQDENGRSGLEVCLHVIDRLLGPSIEDNSATEVGGLAAELVEKAGQERLGPFLPQLLQAVANRLATAQAAQLIQSLIIVFARLSLNSPNDVIEFLSQIQIGEQTGLQVVMAKWLENSINFAGYDEIRQNVIALSKLYALNDQRLSQVSVKGDLIVGNDGGQIKTRSRSKQSMSALRALQETTRAPLSTLKAFLAENLETDDADLPTDPDQYTMVPAPLKIVKLLVDELASASGQRAASNAAAAAVANDELDSDDDDEGWEDDDDTLDMGLPSVKAEFMSYVEAGGRRQPDDETHTFLTEFFLGCGRDNTAGFQDYYNMLNEEEKQTLNTLANTSEK